MNERAYFSPKKTSIYSPPPQRESRFETRPWQDPYDYDEEEAEQELPDVQALLDYKPGGENSILRRLIDTRQNKLAVQSAQGEPETIQRQEQEEEDETLQMKSDGAIQREELPEEEKLQTKLDKSVQRDNLEEELQKSTIQPQKAEEEEKPLQTKLTIGKPGDKYEQEADTMAAKVMTMAEPVKEQEIQPQKLEEEEVQTKPLVSSITPLQRQTLKAIQHKEGKETSKASGNLESRLGSAKGGGNALSDEVRSFMEPRFGADFSGVRVHTDSSAVQMNKELGAKAFTYGNDIFYGKGNSPGNNDLTAHELTHTIQQTGGKLKAKFINKQVHKKNKVSTKAVFPVQRKEVLVSEEVNYKSVEESENPEKKPQLGSSENQNNRQQNTPSPQNLGSEVLQENIDIGSETSSKQEKNTTSQEVGNQGLNVQENQQSGATVTDTTTPETTFDSPELDADFQGVVGKAKEVANQEKKHAPAGTKAKQAQDAAQSPASEVESKAQGNQVGEMEQAPTPAFNAAAFKAKLMERIQEAAPKNLDEADKFKDNNKLGSVKSEMQDKVKQEQTASQTPLEEKAKQAPNTSGIEPKSVTPLPPNQAGTATQNIGAQKAIPKPKGQGEVETPLQESSQKLDQQMADANVTEEQLAKSNEPEFQTALAAKQETKINANQAPQQYRQFEQNQLTQAKGEASATAQQQLQGMHGDRAQLFSQVTNQQVQAKGSDEQERTKIAGDIQGIYLHTKEKVETTLNGLDSKVALAFDNGAVQAQKAFEDYVDKRMKAYKDERYGGKLGWARWGKDLFLGLPSEVNAFYQDGRQLYIKRMDVVLDKIVNIIGNALTNAKAEIANGRKRIQQYVTKLPQNLKNIGQQAATDIQSQFDQLEQSVDSKQDQLINNLAQKYNEKLQTVDSRIEELKTTNQGLVSKATNAMTGVINTINKLKEMLLSVLSKAAGVIGNIIQDPIGFLGNLISGIKQGFENFVGNIGQHLQSGLVGWLTGALGPMGIQLPDDIFSLPGVFSLATQVLGLTFNHIRGKAVKRFGEPVVAGMEQSVEVFQVLRDRGAMGLWEQIKEQFNDLKETVIGEIKNMVITQVITAGVKWIIGLLNPASAFVKAAMAIYDIIMFFVNRGSQVLELVNSVVDAVAKIASGAVGGAAKLVENALSRALPVVIGFMASLLGVSGLAKKVEGVIGRIRERVDKAIDRLLLKAKKLFKGKKGKGNKDEDNRTYKEKQQDLQKAVEKVKKLTDKPEATPESVRNKLLSIKNKFSLSKLELNQSQNSSYQVYAEVNPSITLPLPKLSPGDTDVKNKLVTLRLKPNDIDKIMKSLEQTGGGEKIGNYIKSGVFDRFDGYEDILSNIKLSSEIPSVLQAMNKAQSLISDGYKTLIFEKKSSTPPKYDIDVGVVEPDGSWSRVYQLKYVKGTGNVSKNATGAAKQLVNAPATDKWIEIQVHEGTWADFENEGREQGIKTTFKSTYPNINLRIIFSDGTEKIY